MMQWKRLRKRVWEAAILLLATLSVQASEPKKITQEELVRRTQELMDAVAPGNQEPWKKYFAEDCMYFDEKGRSMDKAALVKNVTAMPAGYSGSIKVVRPASWIVVDTAIRSYDLEETETIYGRELHARYHGTDTWMWRAGSWQIIAGQMPRYYEDPSPGKSDAKLYALYVGTYELAPGVTQVVTSEGGRLYAQRGKGAREELIPEGVDIFFKKGVEGRRVFPMNDAGVVEEMMDRRNNEDVVWKKVK
jgi:Domain of unknown function (DUF4440)/Domain of unknown function (DUF3471)